MSWRITTNFIDKSETVNTSVPILGATVIKAPKGSGNFYFFERGSTQQILNTYGYPSASYPSIQDAIDANLKAGLYISAPSTSGKYGGVFLTKDGTVPFVNGTATKTIADYSAIETEYPIATADGIATIYTVTLPNPTYYVNQSIDIEVDGVSINVAATDVATEVLTTTPAVGSGTYVRSTGVLTFTFLSAPTVGKVITATYSMDIESKVYATLYAHDPQADDLKVQVTKDTVNTTAVNIAVTRYDPIQKAYYAISGSPFNVSFDPLGLDGYGNNIYIGNVFADDEQTIFSVTVQEETLSTYVDDATAKALVGGDRGGTVTGAMLATAYDILEDKVKYPVKVIFDGSAATEVAAKFEALRGGNLNRTRFLYNTANLSATALIADPDTAASDTLDRGLYCYCLAWGIHRDNYQSRDFLCSNMGLVAGKMLDVLNYGPGGVPAWIDENGVGGQLGGAITKFSYPATETQLRQLDEGRLNPVVNDPVYGPVIKSWRTRQAIRSDYSYIGQSSLADWIVELIETQVLPLQIGKPIDDFHMGQVKGKSEAIVGSVARWLEDFYVLCDRTNNTAETMQQQKFILTIGCRFTSYSNTIEFNFINTPQGVTVEEYIKKQ